MNLLEVVYEYQQLLNRRGSVDIPLRKGERVRLLGLGQLLRGDYLGDPDLQKIPRLVHPIPAQFTVPGGFESGEIHGLSASGVAIVTAHPPRVGNRTILRVADPRRGQEFTFPGRVLWSSPKLIGVAFDGVPSRAPFLPRMGSWKKDLRFGRARIAPMVA